MLNEEYIIEPVRDFYEKQYSQPHRRYHTTQHIENMFAYANFNGMSLSEEQVAAIYFHDIFYEVENTNAVPNEVRSSDYAFNIMKSFHNYQFPQMNTTYPYYIF